MTNKGVCDTREQNQSKGAEQVGGVEKQGTIMRGSGKGTKREREVNRARDRDSDR